MLCKVNLIGGVPLALCVEMCQSWAMSLRVRKGHILCAKEKKDGVLCCVGWKLHHGHNHECDAVSGK